MKCKLAFGVVGLAMLATSCMVGPDYHTLQANVASHQTSNSATTNRPFSDAEIYWWRNFNSSWHNLVHLRLPSGCAFPLPGTDKTTTQN